MPGVTFGQDYTPVFKFKRNQLTTAAAVWTPSTSTKIVVTDLLISTGNAVGGTFVLRFGNVAGDVIAAGTIVSSSSISWGLSTPIYSPTYDRALFLETATSASDGGWSVAVSGFEQE